MAPDNDSGNEQPENGKRRVPPAGPRGAQTNLVAPASVASGSVGPQREISRAAEARILREGEAARLALGIRTAREALTDPGVLDAKRLGRLGRDGLARFIAELRHGALGTGRPIGPPASTPARPGPSGGADERVSTPPTVPDAAPPAAAGRQPSDQAARTGSSGKGVLARTAPAARTARLAGWWQSQTQGHPGFEARARRWGCLAGALPIIAGLVWLAMTHR
jgi:hypothetical protein